MRFPIFTNKVLKVTEENYLVTTLEIDHKMNEAKPGQFLMVWIPRVGERPMSIGNNNPLTISVANVGKVSNKISKLKKGDVISYRGPLGKCFQFPVSSIQHQQEIRNWKPHNNDSDVQRIVVIGGGYGVVPMYFLAKTAQENDIEVVAVIGAKTANDLIYEKKFSSICKKVLVTTNDGSRGAKGNVLVEVQKIIEGKFISSVYCCGPEKMMEAVAKLCKQHKISCQVSIERYMKCGIGVCGSCDINGKLCCVDGPVFTGEDALALSEFGKRHRDASGRFF